MMVHARSAVAVAGALLMVAGFRGHALAEVINGGCEIRFLGTSTLHDFSGTARCTPFTAVVVKGNDGRTTIPPVRVEIPVGGMDTGNGSRDGQMRGMFEIDKYPKIGATVGGIDPDGLRREMRQSPQGRGTIDLTLKIRSVERRIRAVASNLGESAGTATFDLEFPVSLKEYNLAPPSVLGIIKVGDMVTVKAAVRVDGLGSE